MLLYNNFDTFEVATPADKRRATHKTTYTVSWKRPSYSSRISRIIGFFRDTSTISRENAMWDAHRHEGMSYEICLCTTIDGDGFRSPINERYHRVIGDSSRKRCLLFYAPQNCGPVVMLTKSKPFII